MHNPFTTREPAGLHRNRNVDLISAARDTLESDGVYGRARAATMLASVEPDGSDVQDVARAASNSLIAPLASMPAVMVERVITSLSLCLVFYGVEQCV